MYIYIYIYIYIYLFLCQSVVWAADFLGEISWPKSGGKDELK